ncbi:MAG TPA: PDZ domain-containing protein [Planctomycetota bacterium]|nr:PDZ domain-containing protein [Planctomycetota bacterium]
MKFAQNRFIVPVALVAALAFGVYGAQTEPPKTEGNTSVKTTDDRIQALEKRMTELENKLFGANDRFSKEMNDTFSQMRREFEGSGHMGRNDFSSGNKPRLGVELAPISDDLKTKFKNDATQGAFVVSVVPNSPAEKGGLMVGDAITSFDGKTVYDPKAIIDGVKAASAGSHPLTVTRNGEVKTLNVEFAADNAPATSLDTPKKQGSWLSWLFGGNQKENVKSNTEVRVSALEMNDTLAKDLKLTDAQKKQMSGILNSEEKALSGELSQEAKPTKEGDMNFSMDDFTALTQKHTDSAEKKLAGVLDAGQLKLWNEYRQAHASASFSQSITIDNVHGQKGVSAK